MFHPLLKLQGCEAHQGETVCVLRYLEAEPTKSLEAHLGYGHLNPRLAAQVIGSVHFNNVRFYIAENRSLIRLFRTFGDRGTSGAIAR